MAQQESFFIQKITFKGQEIPISLITSCRYIETMDMSGPKLIVDFKDVQSIIRDHMKVREGAEIEVKFSDFFRDEGSEEENFALKFIIQTCPNKGGILTLNCFEKNIDKAKQPIQEAKLWVEKKPDKILKDIFPGIEKKDITSTSEHTLHLITGERASMRVRQLVREQGMFCFLRRGKLYYKKFDELKKNPMTYWYDNRKEENQIMTYTHHKNEKIYNERIFKRYTGWSVTEGRIEDGEGDTMVTSYDKADTLQNLSKILVPILSFTVSGNGLVMPGKLTKIKWLQPVKDRPTDESLPAEVMNMAVVHQYEPNFYITHIKGGVMAEKE